MRKIIVFVIGFLLISSLAYGEVTKDKVLVSILLDETGSMNCRGLETTREFNKFIRKFKNVDFYLARFNSEKYVAYDFPIPICQVKFLGDYEPNNNTPLNDSIVRMISALSIYEKDYKKIILGIFTDGEENSSTIYTQEDVSKLIEEKKVKGWDITYMAIKLDDRDSESFNQATRYNFAPAGNRQYFVSHGGVISSDSASNLFDTFSERTACFITK